MKPFVVLLFVLMAMPAHAALAQNWRNIRDVESMVGFLEKHAFVAATLERIDVNNQIIVFNGQCVVQFRVADSRQSPEIIGPRAPLVFAWTTCPLTRDGDLSESDKKHLADSRQESSLQGDCGKGPGRSDDELAAAIDSYRGRFYSKYFQYKKNIPGFKGKVVFRYDILEYGRVMNIQLIEDTMGSEEFVDDLKRILRRVKFCADRAKLTGVELPLNFQ